MANPSAAFTDCPSGSVTANPGLQTITLVNGAIPAQIGATPGACTIVVNVEGRGVASTYTNTIPINNAIATIQGSTSTIRPIAAASANIAVAPLTIGVVKGFDPLTVFGGSTSVLSVELINPNNSALTGIDFTDNMPAGMIIADIPDFDPGSCGPPGSLTGTPGTSTFYFSGGSLPASSICTMTLNVTHDC